MQISPLRVECFYIAPVDNNKWENISWSKGEFVFFSVFKIYFVDNFWTRDIYFAIKIFPSSTFPKCQFIHKFGG